MKRLSLMFVDWVRSWFMVVPDAPSPPIPVTAEIVEFPKKKRTRAVRRDLHITDILDQLPECRKFIEPMKKHAPELYKLWTIMGAKVLLDRDLRSDLASKIPAVGMTYLSASFEEERDDDLFRGMFVGYTELVNDTFWAVVSPGASLYEVYVIFTDERTKRGSLQYYGYSFMVARKDGQMWLPSQRNVTAVRLPRGGTFHRQEWGFPPHLKHHFEECRKSKRFPEAKSISDFGLELFRAATVSYTDGKDDFQVRAERDGVSVAFNVALGLTPQFFKDRETTVASDGRRRRIFHAVKEHTRDLASGATTTVSAHYRGERVFDWNGERITITPSERAFYTTFDAPAYLQRPKEARRGKVHLAEYAHRIRENTEREWRRRAYAR